VQEQETQKI